MSARWGVLVAALAAAALALVVGSRPPQRSEAPERQVASRAGAWWPADPRFSEAGVRAEPLRESTHRAVVPARLAEGDAGETVRHREAFRRLLDTGHASMCRADGPEVPGHMGVRNRAGAADECRFAPDVGTIRKYRAAGGRRSSHQVVPPHVIG